VGARFWDTADVYADTEEIMGKWFERSGKRANIFVATKGSMDRSTGVVIVRSDAEYLRGACEKSLKKLGVDYIDLYYVQRVAYETSIEETIKGLVELKKYAVL
jgi:aryl-alcohol dehydrogenase-like predicted oxidoreductase